MWKPAIFAALRVDLRLELAGTRCDLPPRAARSSTMAMPPRRRRLRERPARPSRRTLQRPPPGLRLRGELHLALERLAERCRATWLVLVARVAEADLRAARLDCRRSSSDLLACRASRVALVLVELGLEPRRRSPDRAPRRTAASSLSMRRRPLIVALSVVDLQVQRAVSACETVFHCVHPLVVAFVRNRRSAIGQPPEALLQRRARCARTCRSRPERRSAPRRRGPARARGAPARCG